MAFVCVFTMCGFLLDALGALMIVTIIASVHEAVVIMMIFFIVLFDS